jgi:hypothetical protein
MRASDQKKAMFASYARCAYRTALGNRTVLLLVRRDKKEPREGGSLRLLCEKQGFLVRLVSGLDRLLSLVVPVDLELLLLPLVGIL